MLIPGPQHRFQALAGFFDMEDLAGLGLLAGSGRLWPALAGLQILWSIRTPLFDPPEALRTRQNFSLFSHFVPVSNGKSVSVFFSLFSVFFQSFFVSSFLEFLFSLGFFHLAVSSWPALAGPGRPWQALAGPGRPWQVWAYTYV